MGNMASDSSTHDSPGQEETLRFLEERAAIAEKRLEEVEKRVACGSGNAVAGGTAALTAAYVNELKELRMVLVQAKQEQDELIEKVASLEQSKAKLEYQVKHLKRALA
jgi:1-aminocyclopropane-1-carboxylate deaminase/D-cysteine desulfhydrase-like pyridoxal-dependent ACC family enzyme